MGSIIDIGLFLNTNRDSIVQGLYPIKFSFWILILFLALMISETIRDIRNSIIKKNQSNTTYTKMLINFIVLMKFTIVSFVVFYLFSANSEELLKGFSDKESIISELFSGMIPDFKMSWSTLVKIVIMTIIARTAIRAWLDMISGKSKAKTLYQLLEKTFKESEFIKSQKSFSFSKNKDMQLLADWMNNLIKRSKRQKDKGIMLDILEPTINSLIKTKDVPIAKSSLDMALMKYEDTIFKDFSQSKVAQATLPLLGFAGTILGIMIAMGDLVDVLLNQDTNGLKSVIASLSVAFDTTLIAVICAYLVRSKERKLLNDTNTILIDIKSILDKEIFNKIST